MRARENVNSGGGYQRHLNDQGSRVTVKERGANIAVWNGRESASVVVTTLDKTTHRTVWPGRHQPNIFTLSILEECLTNIKMVQFIQILQRFDFPQGY